MIKKYIKKPVLIKAVLFDGVNVREIESFVGEGFNYVKATKEIKIPTLEGVMTAQAGDYIIKGIKGEFYPCKPDIFEETYEVVSEG